MNTDNQPTPDDAFRKAWQQAFDDAADAPPPRVWNAIERQLDTDDRAKVIPLWGAARPWLTGVAAAVALLLTGWWTWQYVVPTSPQARQGTAQTTATIVAANRNEARNIPVTSATKSVSSPVIVAAGRQEKADLKQATRFAEAMPSLAATGIPGTTAFQGTSKAEQQAVAMLSAQTFSRPSLASTVNRTDSRVTAVSTFAEEANPFGRFDLSINKLSGKWLKSHPIEIQRMVWYRTEETTTAAPERSEPVGRETWASLSVMPSSFNPEVGIRSIPTAAIVANAYNLAASAVRASSPAFSSQSGGAVTVQAGVGKQLTDRWSVETGVGILQARSTVVSPAQTQVYAVQTGATQTLYAGSTQTLYAAVVENSISKSLPTALYSPSGNQDTKYTLAPTYGPAKQENVRNDYRYVQVPVQVGYQLRPRRRLGLSLLGGLLTSWFVRNTVGETLVVKPSDSVFRPMTLSGTAGARFRYRSSRRWSASLAGVYQQSLQSGTQSDVNLETRPHTVGMSFSMDYHF